MNFHHMQAVRQLNNDRRVNAALLHTGTGVDVNALSRGMQSTYQEQEEIFEKLLRSGPNSLSNPQRYFKNTMSTTSGPEGGFAAPLTVAIEIADALNQFSSVRRMATVVQTFAGENMTYPASDGRGQAGEQLGQNAASTLLDADFAAMALNTFKYGSKVITVPVELVQDSSIDFVSFLNRRIAARIGRVTNSKFTIGTGTGEPMGVVTAAAVGKTGAAGQVATVIFDDLEDLIGSVDAAHRESGKCGWMMNDATLRFIAKMKDSAGQPLKLVRYGNRALGEPTTLLGFSVETNPDMPVMAANAKSILFGDFSNYVVRDVAEIQVFRMTDSAFVNNGQIGFLGMARAGGAYVDLGTAIRAYRHPIA